jgi:hypothetical protein
MKDFTTIDSSTLAAVTGGEGECDYEWILRSHEPQTDTNGAIVGGEPFYRMNNFICNNNGGICGGLRVNTGNR